MEKATNKGREAPNLARQIAQLRELTARQLRERYREVFGYDSNSAHKQHLVRRIAWRLQVLTEGDISERARKRAMKIAVDADLRVTVPDSVIAIAARSRESAGVAESASVSDELPSQPTLAPGAKLTRVYRGRTLSVNVVDDGFEFEGERYASLSAVARAATGTRWNGRLFFGLVERGKARRAR